MLDNRLHKTREWTQCLTLPDGVQIEVRKFEIRTLLTERELLPVFERPASLGKKARRILLPFFGYDPVTGSVNGEEEVKVTLDERMIEVAKVVREVGFDDIPHDMISESPGAYVHFHFFFAGSEAHAMGFLPDFDEMEWYFMVRADIVPAIGR